MRAARNECECPCYLVIRLTCWQLVNYGVFTSMQAGLCGAAPFSARWNAGRLLSGTTTVVVHQVSGMSQRLTE